MSDRHTFGTLDFDVEKFTELLSGRQTYQFLYFPALLCPCRNRSDGSPDRECTNCHGLGYTWSDPPTRTVVQEFYAGSVKKPAIIEHPWLPNDALTSVTLSSEPDDPLDARLDNGHVVFDSDPPEEGDLFIVEYEAPLTVRGLATQLSAHREWRDIGEFDVRDLHLTVDRTTIFADGQTVENPAWSAGEHDRFLFPFAHVRRQDVLYRGETNRLTYAFVHHVDAVQSIDASYTPTLYEEGTDYTVTRGLVEWVAGRGPAANMPYVVNYIAAPEYYVLAGLPQVRHAGEHDLPRRLMLRVWELYRRPNASYGR